MRVTLLMVAVAATGLTLASSAGAGDSECKIAWWKPGAVECGNLGSLRPGETIRIELVSLKEENGNDKPGPVRIDIVDTNTKTKVTTRPLELRLKTIVSYKNETKAEMVVRADAAYEFHTTVTVKLRSTIEH